MNRVRSWVALAGLLLATALWALPQQPAQAAVDWHKGWCYEGEGVAQVIWFAHIDRDLWPEGNTQGYDVRCLTAPSITQYLRPVSDVTGGLDTVPYSGVPVTYAYGYSSMTAIYDIPMWWNCGMGTYEGGWGTRPSSSEGWVDAFSYCIQDYRCPDVGVNSCPDENKSLPTAVPGVNPQYRKAANSSQPDPRPTADSPGEQKAPAGGGYARPTSTARPSAKPSAKASPEPSATRSAAVRSVAPLPAETGSPEASTDSSVPPSTSSAPTTDPDAGVYQEEAAGELAAMDPALGSVQNPWTLVVLIAGLGVAAVGGAVIGLRRRGKLQ